MLEDRQFPEEYTKNLFNVPETSSNLDINSEYTAFPVENRDLFQAGLTTIVPIIGGGERLGTLILSRLQDQFNDDDLILAEYGATVVGMEILREKAEEIEEEARNSFWVMPVTSQVWWAPGRTNAMSATSGVLSLPYARRISVSIFPFRKARSFANRVTSSWWSCFSRNSFRYEGLSEAPSKSFSNSFDVNVTIDSLLSSVSIICKTHLS